MLQQIQDFLWQQIQTNQFLTGGFVLAALSAIAYKLKEVPSRLWTWVKSYFIIEVDILDRDDAFHWIHRWLAVQPYGAKRARSLNCTTCHASNKGGSGRPTHIDDFEEGNQPQIILSPTYGYHWFWYKGRLVKLYRDRNESKELGVKEKFNITMFTRDRRRVMQLLEEAREIVHPKGEKRISILTRQYGSWHTTSTRRPRSLESVVMKHGVTNDLVSRIQKFLNDEKWYAERGIPWRLGVLLKGPPGSGKTSLIYAIASHFGFDVAILSLASISCEDELQRLMADAGSDKIVLIEDIDCVFAKRESTEAPKISFSALLNAIDGVAAGEGRVLFMTTNHPELLDPALIRPGRADIQFEIGLPDKGQASLIFERFFPESCPSQNLRFVEALDLDKTSMAALQGHLTKYSHDPGLAIKHAHECNTNSITETA